MKSNKYLAGLFAVTVLLAACTDESLSPIFYTLENERSLADDRGLPDEATVHWVVKAGAGIRYFAAANTLYTRTDASDWTSVSPPVAGALCNTIEVFSTSGDLYAGFFKTDGTGLGVYTADDPDNVVWTPVPDVNVSDVRINFVKEVNGLVFVSRLGGSTDYSLWYSSDPLTVLFTEITYDVDPTGPIPVTDVVYDGANYWVTVGPLLYSGGVLPNLTQQVFQNPIPPPFSDPKPDGGYRFGGLLLSGAGDLYISATDGKLWKRSAGAWSNVTTREIDGDEVRFTRFVDVTVPSGDVLVGTEGTGYFELVGGDQTNTLRRPAYNISALYNGAINSFFFDTVQGALFACTTGSGLWRAEYIAGDWLWLQE